MRGNLVWVALLLMAPAVGFWMVPRPAPSLEKKLDFMFMQPVSYQRTWRTFTFVVDGEKWNAQLVVPEQGEGYPAIDASGGELNPAVLQALRRSLDPLWGELKAVEARQQPEDASMNCHLRIGDDISVWLDPRSSTGRKLLELFDNTIIGDKRRALMQKGSE